MQIQHYLYSDIDKQKWDACISNSLTPSIYCTATYLDTLADKWEALIVGNYEIIMPIIYKSKYGIKYCYQPSFLPHINIFCTIPITDILLNKFIVKLQSIIPFAEISFLQTIAHTYFPSNYTTSQHQNFELNLIDTYQHIYNNYTTSFKKSLRVAQRYQFQYSTTDNLTDVIIMYKKLYADKIKSLSEHELNNFEKLCGILILQGQCVIKKVSDSQQQTMAFVILFVHKNKLYNILSCNTAVGRKLSANYFMYNEIINEYAGLPYVLDFEGSDIAGIATFFKKMSPIDRPTMALKYNKLPKIIRLFKA